MIFRMGMGTHCSIWRNIFLQWGRLSRNKTQLVGRLCNTQTQACFVQLSTIRKWTVFFIGVFLIQRQRERERKGGRVSVYVLEIFWRRNYLITNKLNKKYNIFSTFIYCKYGDMHLDCKTVLFFFTPYQTIGLVAMYFPNTSLLCTHSGNFTVVSWNHSCSGLPNRHAKGHVASIRDFKGNLPLLMSFIRIYLLLNIQSASVLLHIWLLWKYHSLRQPLCSTKKMNSKSCQVNETHAVGVFHSG